MNYNDSLQHPGYDYLAKKTFIAFKARREMGKNKNGS